MTLISLLTFDRIEEWIVKFDAIVEVIMTHHDVAYKIAEIKNCQPAPELSCTEFYCYCYWTEFYWTESSVKSNFELKLNFTELCYSVLLETKLFYLLNWVSLKRIEA